MLHQNFLAALLLAGAAATAIAGGNVDHRGPELATYCIHDIGRLPELPIGETFITINALNIRNQIVGSISITGGDRTIPFIWDRVHGMRDLGVLPGRTSGNATDINDAGKVVGDMSDPQTGQPLAFIWDKRRGMRALDASLGGGEHGANGINRFGQIAGASDISTSAQVFHAFFRDTNREVFDLGAFPDGHGESSAFALNDRGQVVGIRTDPQVTEAFIWDKRHGIRLLVEDAGALVVFPNDINNRGVVVGGTSAQTTRAFRWTAREGLQDLGSLPDGSEVDYAEAFGINHWDTIVGATQLPAGPGRAFVWTRRSGMRDLNELIDPSSTLAAHIVLRRASAINDAGWIAAGGVDIRDSVSPERGFLLAPRRHPGMPRCR